MTKLEQKQTCLYRHQKGAALLAVLVVALVLVILMGVVSNLLQSRITLAQQSKDNWQDYAALYAKRSELIYLLATQKHTVAGVSQGEVKPAESDDEFSVSFLPVGDEIRTDGFEYQQNSGLTYSIQNTAGLIAINSSDQTWLKAWLKAKGYTSSEQAKLADSVADYADPDDIRRAAGSESSQQQSNQMQVSHYPRNFLLQSCNEVRRIQSWLTILNDFPDFTTVCSLSRSGVLNLNSVPKQLWNVLWPNSVNAVMQRRAESKWLISDSDIIAVEPSFTALSDDYYTVISMQAFAITLTLNNSYDSFLLKINQGLLMPYELKH